MKTITSPSHPLVKHFVRLRTERKERESTRSVLLLGKKMLLPKVQTLIVTDEQSLPEGVSYEALIVVSAAVMKKIWGIASPEGAAAIAELPAFQSLEGKRRILVMDGVSDPGNMGTLIRTALAFGWDGVFLLEGACDPFNDKALRAAKGATFTLPLAWGNWEDLNSLISKNGAKALVADLKGGSPPKALNQPIVLVVGNESLGVSETARRCCQAITLSMSSEMESLNVAVAGGILLYELR
ncbi:MAG: RNA methyltransferase [Waddliaceae bacterium]